jgi:hypothetical protein
MSVAPAVSVRLRVAVGAQELQVLEPVVAPVAVDVVELHVERPPKPLGQTADLAPVFLHTLLEEARFQVTAIGLRSVVDEQRFEGHGSGTGNHRATLHGLLPASKRETEDGRAFANGKAVVVCSLNRVPVVALRKPLVGRDPHAAGVIGNHTLGEAQLGGNRRVRETSIAEGGHCPASLSNWSSGTWFAHEHMFAAHSDELRYLKRKRPANSAGRDQSNVGHWGSGT